MPDLIWEIDDEEGVFLTFDDGPTPGVTEWILATLDKYDAKATFFVLGKNVEMYPPTSTSASSMPGTGSATTPTRTRRDGG